MIGSSDKELAQRELHQRMEWFCRHHTPSDPREAAEFHADFMMVVQAVHHDATRELHMMLMRALAAMPNPANVIERK